MLLLGDKKEIKIKQKEKVKSQELKENELKKRKK
jgi:hypothetical protein